MSIYDYKVKDAKGNDVSLDKYKGKVLLIINSATECGFTPQYELLQNMYKKFGNENFEILDFPCNQFGEQAPGTEDEIKSFCSSRFGVTFPLFSKVEVNGDNAEPIFEYLKSQKSFEGFDKEHPITAILEDIFAKTNPDFASNSEIKWNFTKFLINKDGQVVERFEPTKDMDVVAKKVEELL